MNQSIHPRVRNGKTDFDKVNTSKSPLLAVLEKKKAAIAEHLERHPTDNASKMHLAKLQQRKGI